MFLIDMEAGRIVDDVELKTQLSTAKPYRQWIEQSRYFWVICLRLRAT